jgi:hypothetical protein
LAEEDTNRLTEKEPEVKGTAEVEEATKVAEDDAERMAVDAEVKIGRIMLKRLWRCDFLKKLN